MFGRKAAPREVARKQLGLAGRDLQNVGRKAADAVQKTIRDIASTRDAKKVRKHSQKTQTAMQHLAKTAVKVGRRRAKGVARSKELKRARVSTRMAADATRNAAQASSTSTRAQGRMAMAQARAQGAAAARRAQARSLRAARKTKV